MLLTRRDGPVLTLTLDRPETRNALSADLVDALTQALAEAAADEGVRVIVLAGAGTVFSAGADLAALKALRDASYADNLADSERLGRLFEAILRHPAVVVARVHGHAIAGGCGLAAACDLSLAAESARLGFTEVRIGFVPALVATFVTRRVGETAARDLFLRGHLVGGTEAARIGLVTRAVPDADLDAELDALVREIATQTSRSAVAAHQGAPRRPARALALGRARARRGGECDRPLDGRLPRGRRRLPGKTDPPWRTAGR